MEINAWSRKSPNTSSDFCCNWTITNILTEANKLHNHVCLGVDNVHAHFGLMWHTPEMWTDPGPNLYLHILCLPVGVVVRLCPINVKTAEPIGSIFSAGPHRTPGKVYEWSKFQKIASNKIRFSLNVENLRNYFLLNPQLFLVYVLQRIEKVFTKFELGRWKPTVDSNNYL